MDKLSEAKFRDLYHNFIFVKCPQLVSELTSDRKHEGFIVYVYVDNEQGLSAQPLCLASFENESISMDPLPASNDLLVFRFRETAGTSTTRIDDESSIVVANLCGDYEYLSMAEFDNFEEEYGEFADLMIEQYEEPFPDKQVLRNIVDLDSFRHDYHVDSFSVLLLRSDSADMEGVWVEGERYDLDANIIYGILLNEPFKDFGVHQGEEIEVIPYLTDDGEFHLIHYMMVE